ncbi:MAG TPA: ATP-binding cassette domain-containing protein [Candidatus Eremiobacteraceae bacterium]|nr:ATP-binding cassette domain-containing protein [Candidatus Eremiobacteraceae bacterium]
MLDCRFRKRLPEFELDVDVRIRAQTLALVGRSGAGKTTLLNVIAGLAKPDSGSVSLAGDALVHVESKIDEPPERRKIGYLFQHYALFPHLTVRDNIAYGLFRLDAPSRADRIDRAIALLGLGRVVSAHPTELSGGERQRVALARALVTEPKALLLDEPLAALDVESRARIRLELRDVLARLAIPTIVVTHDYDDARLLGDRIAAMHRGRIVQTGSADEMARFPADDFVAALTGTNIATVSKNGSDRGVTIAFDPWATTLSSVPTGTQYEWRVEIADIRPLGANVRIFARGGATLRIDIAAPDARRAGYGVGDVVFASVQEHSIRTQ